MTPPSKHPAKNVPADNPDADFTRNFSIRGTRTAYGLTVGRHPKFIWYRNAKVGTRTTLALLDAIGTDYQRRQSFDADYTPDDPGAYFKFGFVRNPWDRLVSGWINKITENTNYLFKKNVYKGPDDDFEAFIAFLETRDLTQIDIHFRLQTCLVPVDTLDFVGRFEQMDTDIGHVLTRLGQDPTVLVKRKNVSKNRKPFQAYYTPDLRDRVARLYAADIAALGYRF